MTVASLWKALDRAGCGKRVGVKELLDHHRLKERTNPWNVHEMDKLHRSPQSRPVLAVDLSIWICEALTSSAMRQIHVVDPALQLVYTRTLKLLNLGIRLIVVVEGMRRIRSQTNSNNQDKRDSQGSSEVTEDKFRKRRSGARFWTACERCEEMLQLLGVLVVRAKAEGEALCALLNEKGIVDGVISNDGDCLLFGAKVLYTKFSIENLERSNVIRYDANNIHAIVDDDDSNKYDDTGQNSREGTNTVKLSRSDLIAFGILTGSDLAGDGLEKVGCRKAIRFIRKCQIDNPLKLKDGGTSPAMELLLSWEEAARSSVCAQDPSTKVKAGPYCSCCGHLGTKASHQKNGCKGCGTQPGEPCFQLSPGGRFRKLLRSKALKMGSSFCPSSTIRVYQEPNGNETPTCLVGKTTQSVRMVSPRIEKLLELPVIIWGRSLDESRGYLRKSLCAYLARYGIFQQIMSISATASDTLSEVPKTENYPTAVKINKLLVRAGSPSCEVNWVIKGVLVDREDNSMDHYEFATIEDESLVKRCYPKLLQEFHDHQKQLQRQGSSEQEKRLAFLLGMSKPNHSNDSKNETKKDRARQNSFDSFQHTDDQPRDALKSLGDDAKAIIAKMRERKRLKDAKNERKEDGSLIGRVLVCDRTLPFIPKQRHIRKIEVDGLEFEQIDDDSSTIHTNTLTDADRKRSERGGNPSIQGLNPGDMPFSSSQSRSGDLWKEAFIPFLSSVASKDAPPIPRELFPQTEIVKPFPSKKSWYNIDGHGMKRRRDFEGVQDNETCRDFEERAFGRERHEHYCSKHCNDGRTSPSPLLKRQKSNNRHQCTEIFDGRWRLDTKFLFSSSNPSSSKLAKGKVCETIGTDNMKLLDATFQHDWNRTSHNGSKNIVHSNREDGYRYGHLRTEKGMMKFSSDQSIYDPDLLRERIYRNLQATVATKENFHLGPKILNDWHDEERLYRRETIPSDSTRGMISKGNHRFDASYRLSTIHGVKDQLMILERDREDFEHRSDRPQRLSNTSVRDDAFSRDINFLNGRDKLQFTEKETENNRDDDQLSFLNLRYGGPNDDMDTIKMKRAFREEAMHGCTSKVCDNSKSIEWLGQRGKNNSKQKYLGLQPWMPRRFVSQEPGHLESFSSANSDFCVHDILESGSEVAACLQSRVESRFRRARVDQLCSQCLLP